MALIVIASLPIAAAAQDKLLLTELVVTQTEGEFVEIYNPGSASIELADYYLTDASLPPRGGCRRTK